MDNTTATLVSLLGINNILGILTLIVVGAEVFAFIDALTHKPEAYVAAGKQTKVFWTLFLGIAAVITFSTRQFIGLLGLIGVVAVIVYLVDVRPALRSMRGGRGPDRHMGPYGPW